MDHFDLMGLRRRYALDPQELEERYRELSRQWHPDRHGQVHAPAAGRAAILRRASDLNEAYRTLRSDARRAEYLLRLHGIDVGAEKPDQPVDPALLGEVLELREALHDARQQRNQPQVRRLDAEVRGLMDAALREVAAGFARLEAGDRGALDGIARALVALRYYQRFREEVETYEESLQ